MRIASKIAVAALAGPIIANFVPQASAQDAARSAAIHKCIMEAQARYPNAADENTQRARTDVYVSCMRSAGQAP